MNTRLQVEHPVTEWVTGIDLVQWQIRIAAGERLTLQQEDVRWTGSSIECRVYAEDPQNNFFPSPGRIAQYVEPSGPGVRVDGGVYAGWTVPIDYDPLLAKLSVWAGTRPAAIARMSRAVAEYQVLGITTNLGLFERLMADERWLRGNLDTGFVEDFMKQTALPQPDEGALIASVLAAASLNHRYKSPVLASVAEKSNWRAAAKTAILR